MAAKAKHADRISDFSAGEGDTLDLSGMDAIEGGRHDAFRFIGSVPFSGAAGELATTRIGQGFYLVGDTDGNAAADFYIRLDNVASLNAGAFTADSLLH